MRGRKSIARVREGKSNIWSWGIVSNWFPICRIDYIYGIGRHQDKDYLRQPMMVKIVICDQYPTFFEDLNS